MSLEDIVDVQISVTGAAVARTGFGVGLIAAYLDVWGTISGERVRTYASPKAMLDDGFSIHDAAYKCALAMFSQQPRPKSVKVGRRALGFTQTVRLTPAAVATGKVYTATIDGHAVTYTALSTDNLAAVCTALAAAANAVNGHDADAIIATGGSTAGTQTLTTTSLNGVVGTAAMDPPRSLEFVFSSHADWDATTITVTGTNAADDVITETFAVPNNGNATVTGSKRFKKVTSVAIPAQSGTGGTFTLGIRGRFTATGAPGTYVSVAATDTGMVIPFEDATATLSLSDVTADPGIATDLAAIIGADPDFYGLLLDSNSEAEIEAAAASNEATERLLVAQTADTLVMDSATTTDVASDLKAAAYGRTAVMFHPNIGSDMLAAGLLGQRLVDDPGSDSWAYKTVRGVGVYALTETQKASLHAKNVTTYTTVGGVAITEGVKVAGGEWIDVVRGIDWLRARIRERILALLVANPKLAYTQAGIDAVVGQVVAQLNDGIAVEFLAPEPAPVVTAPKLAEIDPADKQARLLRGVEFSATLAGAIHAVTITGSVSF